MLLERKNKNLQDIATVGTGIVIFLLSIAIAFGQESMVTSGTVEAETQEVAASHSSKPVFSEYRGIAIGTRETELLERLGTKSTFQGDDDYFYILSSTESAQFLLDRERRVKLISVTYSGNNSKAPSYQDVFGKDAEVKLTSDGNIYHLVNYVEAGFWVAYYKSADPESMVTITMQKPLSVE